MKSSIARHNTRMQGYWQLQAVIGYALENTNHQMHYAALNRHKDFHITHAIFLSMMSISAGN